MTDNQARFNYGVAFDCFLLVCFLTNIGIVINQSGPQIILKLKRLNYQRRHRRDEKMLDKFFDREERIIICHEQLQLAHRRNFVTILKDRKVPFDPETFKIKVEKPVPPTIDAQ